MKASDHCKVLVDELKQLMALVDPVKNKNWFEEASEVNSGGGGGQDHGGSNDNQDDYQDDGGNDGNDQDQDW
jgi:hypothetical protein